MSGVNLFFNKNLLDIGLRKPIIWSYTHAPHLLAIGASGSGKTYSMLLLMAKVAKNVPGAAMTVLDFKGDGDFDFLTGCAAFFQYRDCAEGLQRFFAAFERRQCGADKSRDFRMLVFDEWASYLNGITDKKQAEADRVKMATLLMLGRSYNFHILVGTQRADAENFAKGARDNFSLVALGNLSSEQKQMFFTAEQREKLLPVYERGAGYMLINGAELTRIQVQTVGNTELLQAYIREAVTAMQDDLL